MRNYSNEKGTLLSAGTRYVQASLKSIELLCLTTF